MPGGAVATKRRAQLIKEIYWTPLTLTPAVAVTKWRCCASYMGVFIDNRPRRARAGAARKRSAPSPWLNAGGKKDQVRRG